MPYYFTKHSDFNDVGTGFVGVLDIITGLMVHYSLSFSFSNFSIVIFLSFFYLSLGIWSVITNVLKGNYYDWRGVVDVINGVSLFLVYSGNIFDLLRLIGIMIIIKGGLSLFLITGRKFNQW